MYLRGVVLIQRGDPAAAESFLIQSLNLVTIWHGDYLMANDKYRLAQVYSETSQLQIALQMTEEAHDLELTRKDGDAKVEYELIFDSLVCSKATGLTYCNVACNRTGLSKHSTYAKMAERASCLIWKRVRSIHSFVKLAKKDSIAALSEQ